MFWKKTLLTTAAFSLALTSGIPLSTRIAMSSEAPEVGAMMKEDYDRAFLNSLTARIRQDHENIVSIVEEARNEKPHLTTQIDGIYQLLAEEVAPYDHRPAPEKETTATTLEQEADQEEEDDDTGLFFIYGGLGFSAIASAAILISTGGGSGGSDGGSKRKKRELSEEYKKSGGLEQIKAQDAYDRGFAGQGVMVAVVDDGFDLDHPELEGRLVSPYNAVREGDELPSLNHGTHVAGIIGARKNDDGMHGVAWRSDIMPIAVANDQGQIAPVGRGQWVKSAWNHALDHGASVINNSWGIRGIHAGDMSGAIFERDFGDVVEAARRVADEDAIAVFSTGNDREDQPSYLAALPAEFAELEGHWAAVTAVDSSGELAVYANACGDAADWCLSAPGNSIYAPVQGGYGSYSGTSMATPHVSGAIAVLKSAFPHLSAPEVLEILFETADDIGDKAIYGHGLVNLDRATRPVGETRIPLAGDVSGSAAHLSGTSLHASAAFGDGIAQALAGQTVMALDAYDRGYQYRLDNLVRGAGVDRREALHRLKLFGGMEERTTRTVETGPFSITTAARMRASDVSLGSTPYSRMSFGFTSGNFSLEASLNPDVGRSFGLHGAGLGDAPLVHGQSLDQPHLGLLESGYGASLSFGLDQRSDLRLGAFTGNLASERPALFSAAPTMYGAVGEINSQLWKDFQIKAAVGAVSEEGSLLGSVSSGAFGEHLRSNTMFANLGAVAEISRKIRLTFSAALGNTSFEQKGGLLRSGRGIVTSSFGVALSSRDLVEENDALTVAVSQPLRVESGKIDLSVPASRGLDGSVDSRRVSLSPQPSGRELDLQASYKVDLVDGVETVFGVMHRFNAGHSSGSSETLGMMSVSLSF